MSDVTKNPWDNLRTVTPARIGLGRAGVALPTAAHLEFQFAHARARDAVHSALDCAQLANDLSDFDVIQVASAAPDRASYLRRPDLGRQLNDGASSQLPTPAEWDVVFIAADGLSSAATQTHAASVIRASVQKLSGLSIAPIVLATQARVAIGDEIGALLGARIVVLFIGERPGLTVADSLGAYITYAPQIGTPDSARNCISNIHTTGGLSYESAAEKIAWLVRTALQRGLTGTGLKEESDAPLMADTVHVPSGLIE